MKLKSHQGEITDTEITTKIDFSSLPENSRYGYIYLTTNNVNGKIYIGKCHDSSFHSDYLGSGISLNRAIDKYGIESFSVMLLFYVSTKKELNFQEKLLISRYREALGRENVYNIADGGDGGPLRLGMKGNFKEGTHQTEEHKRKIGKANKGTKHSPESIAQQKESRKWYKPTKETIEKQRLSMIASWTPERRASAKGKISWNKGTAKPVNTAPKTGKHQTPLQIQKRNAWRHLLPTDLPPILPVVIKVPKIRKPNPPVTEETRQKLRDLATKNRQNNIDTHTGSNNVRYGKKHSPETIRKMKIKAQSRPPVSEEVKKRISNTLTVRNIVLKVIKRLDKDGTLAVI